MDCVVFDLISSVLSTNLESIKYLHLPILLKVNNRCRLFEVVNYSYPVPNYITIKTSPLPVPYTLLKLGAPGET